MDNPGLPFAVIAAVILGAVLLPRWIRSSSKAAGERTAQRAADSRLIKILDELGTTPVIHAPEPVSREIVDRVVLQHPRKFTALPDGSYGIRFVEADDALVRLVDDPVGTRLQIERVREHLGMPTASGFWSDLRERVTSAAAAQGIAVADGTRARLVRRAPAADGSVTWEAPA